MLTKNEALDVFSPFFSGEESFSINYTRINDEIRRMKADEINRWDRFRLRKFFKGISKTTSIPDAIRYAYRYLDKNWENLKHIRRMWILDKMIMMAYVISLNKFTDII